MNIKLKELIYATFVIITLFSIAYINDEATKKIIPKIQYIDTIRLVSNVYADSVLITDEEYYRYTFKIFPNKNYNFMKSDTLFKGSDYSYNKESFTIMQNMDSYYLSTAGIDELWIIDEYYDNEKTIIVFK